MSHLKLNQVTDAETSDSHWKGLYKVAAAAALLIVAMIPIQAIVFVAWPPPDFLPNVSTVTDWFTLFQNNWLLGLLELDLLLIADYALGGLVTLALYVALRRTSESFTAIALILGLVGIADYIASNPAFSMLSLSDQYAAATTDAQRSMFLAAGQAMLAVYQGTAFLVSFVLLVVAPLILSVVMLRSNIFSKVTAYVGILGSAIALAIGPLLSLISVVVFAIWYILIARRLFQLGQSASKEEANRNETGRNLWLCRRKNR